MKSIVIDQNQAQMASNCQQMSYIWMSGSNILKFVVADSIIATIANPHWYSDRKGKIGV